MTEPPAEGSLELGSAPLRDYFAARLPERLRQIEDAWTEVRATGWSAGAAHNFHRLVHSLSGAGSTFGFPAVSEAARRLERLLKPVVQGTATPPADETVGELLAGIRRSG
ncbi:MAG TPA: Hpt domain-containing protein [Thermoanaerobaculia bacterium]|nr:Hpt domain-containing protein [Thermoanaerobaculia bacterium]